MFVQLMKKNFRADYNRGEGKIHPRIGHEGPDGE